MDWWKMFGSTFILIFLAELGDKTQLAAMARAADGPDGSAAKWVVFLAASSALVLSTLIAVFFGGLLRSLVPDERYIKIAAGTLFVVFGVWILIGVYRSYSGEEAGGESAPSAPAAAENTGYLGELALRAALDFESAMGEKYRRLARSADFELAELLSELAREEDGHLSRLSHLSLHEREKAFASQRKVGTTAVENVPESRRGQRPSLNLVRDLANHEKATAAFYQSLADQTLISSLKPLFSRLADEERGHAARIERFIQSRGGQAG